MVDTPVLELNSDAALILKGIKATADTDPGLFRFQESFLDDYCPLVLTTN